jgi:hypothetical protein
VRLESFENGTRQLTILIDVRTDKLSNEEISAIEENRQKRVSKLEK